MPSSEDMVFQVVPRRKNSVVYVMRRTQLTTCVCCVLHVLPCTGASEDKVGLAEVVPEVVVPIVVKVVRPRLAPRVLGGDKFVTVVDKIGDRTRKLGVVEAAVAAVTQSGDVILPDNADGVIRLFLGGKLTKRKGHQRT